MACPVLIQSSADGYRHGHSATSVTRFQRRSTAAFSWGMGYKHGSNCWRQDSSTAAEGNPRSQDGFTEDVYQCIRNAEEAKVSEIPDGPTPLFSWSYNFFHLPHTSTLANRTTRARHSSKSDQQVKQTSTAESLSKLLPPPGAESTPATSDEVKARLLDDWNKLPGDFEALSINRDITNTVHGKTQTGNRQRPGKGTTGHGRSYQGDTSSGAPESKSSNRLNKPNASRYHTYNGDKDPHDNNDDNSGPPENGGDKGPGRKKDPHDNGKRFTCCWYKFDPIRHPKCHLQFKTISYFWSHVEKEHIGYDCSSCGRLVRKMAELQQDQGCNHANQELHGLITHDRLEQAKAAVNYMKERNRRERKTMPKQEQVEQEWIDAYWNLFGRSRPVDPYWHESLYAEIVDHREYFLSHPGEMEGTFLSEFLNRARETLGVGSPSTLGYGQTPSGLTEPSTGPEGIHDRFDASKSATTLNNTPEPSLSEVPRTEETTSYKPKDNSFLALHAYQAPIANPKTPAQPPLGQTAPANPSLIPDSRPLGYDMTAYSHFDNTGGDNTGSLAAFPGQQTFSQTQCMGPAMMPSSHPGIAMQPQVLNSYLTVPSSSSSSSTYWMPPTCYANNAWHPMMGSPGQSGISQQTQPTFSRSSKRQRGEDDTWGN